MLTLAKSRRSMCLLVFGIIYITLGITTIGTEDLIRKSPLALQSYKAHLYVMPMDVWGIIFISVGIIAMIAALTMFHTPGFLCLMGLSFFWALMFIASFAVSGYERILISVATWGLLTALIAIISGWPDPRPVGPSGVSDSKSI